VYRHRASCYNTALPVFLAALAVLLGVGALLLFLRERSQARRFRDQVADRLDERARRRITPPPA
jgi:hypothetical protein